LIQLPNTTLGDNSRLLNRKFYLFPSGSANPDIVSIKSVSIPEIEKKLNKNPDYIGTIQDFTDEFGGKGKEFLKSFDWVIGEPLWVTVELRAIKPWSGYISFRSKTDRRAAVRKRLKFMASHNVTR